MAYDSSLATNVRVQHDDAELLVTWSSSAPAGQYFQIYVARRLVWSGQSFRAKVPYPGGSRVAIDVGGIATGDVGTDFSGSLPASDSNAALITWTGGSYLDPTGNGDVVGFKIYMGTVAGGAVSYTKPIADVAAYAQGQAIDGFGLGGFGEGGFGFASGTYSWTSGPLTNGVWNFAVKDYDLSGNLSTAVTGSVTIATAPRPPAANASGLRLTRTYNASTHVVTLNWLASPG